MKDLKQKAIRGGFAKICAQGTTFTLRIGSLMILARLLDPKDFGLVGMVTAFTGILNLFRDFGLSTATVQRVHVTEEQISTLFWINLLVGAVLCLGLAAGAPFVASFYHEPRLLWVTIVLALGFVFNAAGIQHSALLQRQMRFTALATIDVISLSLSVALGLCLAYLGFGYWALVAMSIAPPLLTTVSLWKTTAWVPGRPRHSAEVLSLLKFGGTLTLNSIVVYVAYNLEKVLLGRYWGAEALGIYGRSYQLINIPTDNLNSAAGEVAFPALARVQNEPVRLRSYFLKGYSLTLAITIPITIAVALFSNDIIRVVLGPKWHESAIIFRLLAPTILIFAMINPLAWLMFSLGLVKRSLHVAMVLAPIVMAGYLVGLPHGPKGVALGYSSVMILWVLPHIAWCVRGTPIKFRDILGSAARPLVSGLVAAAVVFAAQMAYGSTLIPILRLLLGGVLLLAVYGGMLLYVMGQKSVYLELLRNMRNPRPAEQNALASA